MFILENARKYENVYYIFPEPEVKLLVLPNQQSKTQIFLIYIDVKLKKQQILTFDKLEPANVCQFCFMNYLPR